MNELKELAEKIGPEKIYVNTVLPTIANKDIDYKWVEKVVTAYAPYIKTIIFRENWVERLINRPADKVVREEFKKISNKAQFRADINVLCLIDGKLVTCAYIDKYYLGIEVRREPKIITE